MAPEGQASHQHASNNNKQAGAAHKEIGFLIPSSCCSPASQALAKHIFLRSPSKNLLIVLSFNISEIALAISSS
jgi:hypothetical protein